MSHPFTEIYADPDCEYIGELIKHVRFLACGGKNTAFLTVSESVNKNMMNINIYFNNIRVRGMRVKKNDKLKFTSFEILTGLAYDKGLLNTSISDHDLKTNYRGNYADSKRATNS